MCRLKEKYSSFRKPASASMVKQDRRINIGWTNFEAGEFRQVRQKSGGGIRELKVSRDITITELKDLAIKKFFPNGRSPKGPVQDFLIDMMDFAHQPVPEDRTVGQLYDHSGLKLLRIYMATRSVVEVETPCSTSKRKAAPHVYHSLGKSPKGKARTSTADVFSPSTSNVEGHNPLTGDELLSRAVVELFDQDDVDNLPDAFDLIGESSEDIAPSPSCSSVKKLLPSDWKIIDEDIYMKRSPGSIIANVSVLSRHL